MVYIVVILGARVHPGLLRHTPVVMFHFISLCTGNKKPSAFWVPRLPRKPVAALVS